MKDPMRKGSFVPKNVPGVGWGASYMGGVGVSYTGVWSGMDMGGMGWI